MDNGNLAGIVANGAMGGNEFTLDGAPNRVSPNNTTAGNNNGVVGFSPPSDAIAEFKVQTNAFDAQSGQTAGATVNLALKSGTNSFHGAAAYFNRSDSRSETPLLSERAGAEKPTRTYNRYTGTLLGPIRTTGRSSWSPSSSCATCSPSRRPTPCPRRDAPGRPLGVGHDRLRSPYPDGAEQPAHRLPGEPHPGRPHQPRGRRVHGALSRAQPPGLEDNYFTNKLRPYDYNAVLGRIDHNFNPRNKIFVNGYWNKREEDRYNWALGAANATGEGAINGFEVTHGFDYRSNLGGTLGYTSTLSSNLRLRRPGRLVEVRRVAPAGPGVRSRDARLRAARRSR